MPTHGAPADPYRVFFPLGIALGIAGVSIWLAYGLGLTAGYSGPVVLESHERRSWPLRIGIATGLLALLARLGAAFAPESYFEHLATAALLWIAGVLFWGIRIVRFIRTRTIPKPEG